MSIPPTGVADLVGPAVVGVDNRPSESRSGDPALVDDSLLFDEERALVASVAPGRFRDFVLGRRCARLAVEGLGLEPAPILVGERRQPLWPAGVVGAITHTEGYVAAAVARADEVASIGIDAEADERLPDGVERRIVRPDEQRLLGLDDVGVTAVDRLIFSAKEAVYKAWFPLTGEWLGFLDARLELDPQGRRFAAHVLVDAPEVHGRRLQVFEGRYASVDGVIITTVEHPAP
ncbi:MAG: 4'-phosphopantetheinyl transferase [Acidimicrobiales bacterium]